MGKFSRDKGNRVERRIVNDLRAMGWHAVRVPLSGASEAMKGDVRVSSPDGKTALCGEVKARKSFPKWLTDMLGDNDVLFVVEDRKEPLVIQRLSVWGKR